MQELLTGEVEIAIAGFRGKILRDPLDEFPVAGIEGFLFASGSFGEVSEICGGYLAIASSWPVDEKLDLQEVQTGIGILWLWH